MKNAGLGTIWQGPQNKANKSPSREGRKKSKEGEKGQRQG